MILWGNGMGALVRPSHVSDVFTLEAGVSQALIN